MSCQPNNLNKNNVYKSLFGWWQNVDMAFLYVFLQASIEGSENLILLVTGLTMPKKTEQDLWKSVRVWVALVTYPFNWNFYLDIPFLSW